MNLAPTELIEVTNDDNGKKILIVSSLNEEDSIIEVNAGVNQNVCHKMFTPICSSSCKNYLPCLAVFPAKGKHGRQA